MHMLSNPAILVCCTFLHSGLLHSNVKSEFSWYSVSNMYLDNHIFRLQTTVVASPPESSLGAWYWPGPSLSPHASWHFWSYLLSTTWVWQELSAAYLFNPRTSIATPRMRLSNSCFDKTPGSVFTHVSPSSMATLFRCQAQSGLQHQIYIRMDSQLNTWYDQVQ